METAPARQAFTPYVRKVHFYETDQMGIVHHSNFIRWMEEARVDFMEQLGYGYDRATREGIDFVLMGISCDYKSMVRFADTVRIETDITDFGPVKLTVRYRMFDQPTGELRATGESRHCCYDSRRKRPAGLNRVLPELYDLMQAYYQDFLNQEE